MRWLIESTLTSHRTFGSTACCFWLVVACSPANKVGIAIDRYMGFGFEPPWQGTRFVRAFRILILIDNAEVLHHRILFEELGALDGRAVDILGAHPVGAMMHGWAPGGNDLYFTPDHQKLAKQLAPWTPTLQPENPASVAGAGAKTSSNATAANTPAATPVAIATRSPAIARSRSALVRGGESGDDGNHQASRLHLRKGPVAVQIMLQIFAFQALHHESLIQCRRERARLPRKVPARQSCSLCRNIRRMPIIRGCRLLPKAESRRSRRR